MTSTPSTQERAQETASTAADEGKHVAGVARDEAQNVAAQATEHARGLMDDAMSQVQEQSRSQRDLLVGTLRSFSDDLEQMAGQGDGSGLAGQVVRQVADRTRGITDHIDGREPADLLDDVRGFARRRPGTFLLGALAAGVVAGRLARGARDAKSGNGSSGSGASRGTTYGATGGATGQAGTTTSYGSGPEAYGDVPGTASGDPLAGVGTPTTEPAYPADTGTGYPTTAGGVTPTDTELPGTDPATGPGAGAPTQRPAGGGTGL